MMGPSGRGTHEPIPWRPGRDPGHFRAGALWWRSEVTGCYGCGARPRPTPWPPCSCACVTPPARSPPLLRLVRKLSVRAFFRFLVLRAGGGAGFTREILREVERRPRIEISPVPSMVIYQGKSDLHPEWQRPSLVLGRVDVRIRSKSSV